MFWLNRTLENFVYKMLRRSICLPEKGKHPTSISVLGFVMCSSPSGCSSIKLASVFCTTDKNKDT